MDKDGGVTIDDCELISKELEKVLDENDPIEQAYFLEISSPGIDRPLKKKEDFIKFNGETVDVKLYRPIEGSKEHRGKLVDFSEDGTVTIETDDDKNYRLRKRYSGRKACGNILKGRIFKKWTAPNLWRH